MSSIPDQDYDKQPRPQPIVSVDQYRRPPGAESNNIEPGGAAPTRLPKRIVQCPCRGAYKGFWVKAWVNYPMSLLKRANKLVADTEDPDEFGIDDEEKARRLDARTEAQDKQARILGDIVLETNLVDFEGKSFGDPATREFWEAVQGEAQAVIFDAIGRQIGRLDPQKSAKP
jgi:hypothetical protein